MTSCPLVSGVAGHETTPETWVFTPLPQPTGVIFMATGLEGSRPATIHLWGENTVESVGSFWLTLKAFPLCQHKENTLQLFSIVILGSNTTQSKYDINGHSQ